MAFPSGWQRKCGLTVQHSQVPASQTAFPVLVTEASLPAEMMTVGDTNAAQSDGGDIRFSSDSTGASQLACEVVFWNQNANPALAKAEIWVPVNVLTASDVTIYIWYKAGGGLTQPAANAAFGSQAVWDTNFLGVWHLPDGTTPTAGDSTSNANSGTLVNSPTAVAGKIDGGIGFTAGSSQYIDAGTPVINSVALTVSAWFKAASAVGTAITQWDNAGTHSSLILDQNGGSGAARFAVKESPGGSSTARIVNGTANVCDGTWHYLTGTAQGGVSNVILYTNAAVDGTPETLATVINNPSASHLYFGRYVDGLYLTGNLDEIRISNVARSAAWITTEYNNQNSPATFLIAGSSSGVATGSPITLLGSGR